MSTEITIKKYTRQEAETATEEFIATGSRVRQLLLDLYEREAHTALGYSTFEEYTRDRLGAEWKDDYLRKLRLWARIERGVLLISNNGVMIASPTKRLTQSEAMQLARLPFDQQKVTYEECMELCDKGKNYRPQSFLTNLTHIVNRRLKAITPSPTESPSVPPAPAPPSPPSAPPAPPATTKRIKTYTPPPDPEPLVEPAWYEWEECLNTQLTWVQYQYIDGDLRLRRQVNKALSDMIKWNDENQ